MWIVNVLVGLNGFKGCVGFEKFVVEFKIGDVKFVV